MGSLRAVLAEFTALGIWTGWLAMVIFVPLAITSTDGFVRRMGPAWKTLQRTVYVAAVATLLHWIFVHNNLGPALFHFVPLALLEAYRIWRKFHRSYQPV
jgi:sulfoxide reductase heme-binding subunit YedZ